MKIPSFDFERRYWEQEISLVAGLDEVGVGAWAGPVVAGAVMFKEETPHFFSPLSGGEMRKKALKINRELAYVPYLKRLTEQAREMRNNPTKAEQVFWKAILSHDLLKQYRFRRQRPLRHFIVDFYSPSLLLAVEVDGDSHDKQRDYDEARSGSLSDYGIQVIRYTNTDVLQRSDWVYSDLMEKISKRSVMLGPPDRGDTGGLIRDSKTLSLQQREKAAVWIKEHALAWAVGEASVEEICELNILQAARLAMRRAVGQLSFLPELLLVDGYAASLHPTIPHESIVKGDQKSFSIAAASIVAKVHRDTIMCQLAEQFPGYGFEAHKGYGSEQHQAALRAQGACPCHRAAYAPIAAYLTQG